MDCTSRRSFWFLPAWLFLSYSVPQPGHRIRFLSNRVEKMAIANAIYQAFYYFGREYDFRFSFDSEGTMVCTELVSKAFVSSDESGLKLPYIKKTGKFGVTADAIVENFDGEHGTAESQLDFVSFI